MQAQREDVGKTQGDGGRLRAPDGSLRGNQPSDALVSGVETPRLRENKFTLLKPPARRRLALAPWQSDRFWATFDS